MKTDIEIAQAAKLKPIWEIAEKAGLKREELQLFGDYKAKVELGALKRLEKQRDGKLILVTAITPTPLGEGKTVTTVGLGQALNHIGKKAFTAIRQPSLGPVFGVKGGAAGGGHAQVVPMEDINLHFTGDMHAITAAHSLLAAMLDAHLFHGNALGMDVNNVTWKRAVDMNDRALRDIVVGLGGRANGVPRQDGFIITVASEIMAILCLSRDFLDLKERLGRIIVAYAKDGKPVTARDLGAQGAMALLLKDAIKPNLVQTLEHTPAFVHGGPFANIAHGHNTLIADRLALKLADYVVTETGFGADLGAEKFFNIVCRLGGLTPSAAVVVVSLRALKMHGLNMWPVKQDVLKAENVQAIEKGFPNLDKHLANVQLFGVPAVAAINRRPEDTDAEVNVVLKHCKSLGVLAAVSEVWAHGGAGGATLAEAVVQTLEEKPSRYKPLYEVSASIPAKIETIAKKIYGAKDVDYAPKAKRAIANLEKLKLDQVPICMAKTNHSISDNSALKGAPTGWTLTINDLYASAGAGFIVALAGDVLTMPGLPQHPAALDIDIDEHGTIKGLF
ncbi:MAG TPA: formate--tetrahydrofolate ligase [Candidatus Bipolaricaulota bacterium]